MIMPKFGGARRTECIALVHSLFKSSITAASSLSTNKGVGLSVSSSLTTPLQKQ